MEPPSEVGSPEEWRELLERTRERIAARKARLAEATAGPVPAPGGTFRERYDRLVDDLRGFLEELPEIEHEPQGPAGLRIRFAPADREVRVTPLEDQSLVHFVFGHTTLGTLHRAEHHAARPFGDRPPDIPRLLRQLLAFLIEGIEPRWLSRRPVAGSTDRGPAAGTEVLELPLD